MKLFAVVFSMSLLAGCLTSTVPPVTYWTITPCDAKPAVEKAKYGVLRVSQIVVCQPYDSRSLVLCRADGSVAFDPYNQFAVQPSQLIRLPVVAELRNSGLFGDVVWSTSSAACDAIAEVTVTDLSLVADASKALTANTRVMVRLLDSRRAIMATACGTGSAQVDGGNYARAYSTAMSEAMKSALSKL